MAILHHLGLADVATENDEYGRVDIVLPAHHLIAVTGVWRCEPCLAMTGKAKQEV